MTQAMFPTNYHANFEQTFEMSQKSIKKERKKRECEIGMLPSARLEKTNQAMQSLICQMLTLRIAVKNKK